MILSFLKNPCNVYFGLWCLYALQGTLYPSGSFLSQSLIMVLIVIGLKELLSLLLTSNRGAYLNSLCVLVGMHSLYGLVLLITNSDINISSYLYLKKYLASLTPIIVCYNYSKNEYLNKNILKKWVILFFIVAIMQYFRLQREGLEGNYLREEITNNAGYVLLSIIPSLVLFNNKIVIKYTMIFVCSLFVLFSMKRGAILILLILLSVIIWNDMHNAIRKNFFIFILIMSVVIGIAFSVQYLLESSAYFNTRIEQTKNLNSSERDVYYAFFIDSFLNDTNGIQMLFGRGAESTVKIFGHYAHNDWLETLTNQGLLGVVIFLIYWINFAKLLKNYELSISSRSILLLSFLLYGTKTMFSMSIMDMDIYVTSCIGLAIADRFKDNEFDQSRINENTNSRRFLSYQ